MQISPDPKPLPRLRDKKRLEFTAMHRCMGCGRIPAGQAHHVRWAEQPCGMGRKPGDDKTIPLCFLCHDKLHNYRLNLGREEIQDQMDALDAEWKEAI